MAYNSISIKPYIKSHLELQREIALIELAPSPFLSKVFVLHIWTCRDENSQSFSIRKISLLNPEWSQTDFYITYKMLNITNINRKQSVYA